MKKTLINYILFLIIFTSCKTAEQIEREKIVDDLSLQVNTSQKISADATNRLQRIEERLSALTGKFEEQSYFKSQESESMYKSMGERISSLEQDVKEMDNKLKLAIGQLESQKKYLDQVISSLKEMGGKKKLTNLDNSSNKKEDPFEEAMDLYKNKKYSEARNLLLKLNQEKKYKGNQKARIVHNLGYIEYQRKNYQDSLVYFSQVVTDFSKSTYNKNALYYLGMNFMGLKDKDQAKLSFNELIKIYPDSWQAKDAIKIVQKL